jgi:hypothetical protein
MSWLESPVIAWVGGGNGSETCVGTTLQAVKNKTDIANKRITFL